MRRVLKAKLELDGVRWDEFVLKPNLKNFMRGRFRALRQQIPYKLPALLASRSQNGGAPETLFGDDAESDAIVYSLYADVLSGRAGKREVLRVLELTRAYDDQIDECVALIETVAPPGAPVSERGDPVRRILIHLDRRTAPARFDRYGPRLVPIFNYFQGAIVLYGDDILTAADVVGVAKEMYVSGEYTLPALANSLQDLLRRGRITRAEAIRLALESQAAVERHSVDWPNAPPKEQIAWAFATRVRGLGEAAEAPPRDPVCIDYEAILGEDH
jgi:hypothetical protein